MTARNNKQQATDNNDGWQQQLTTTDDNNTMTTDNGDRQWGWMTSWATMSDNDDWLKQQMTMTMTNDDVGRQRQTTTTDNDDRQWRQTTMAGAPAVCLMASMAAIQPSKNARCWPAASSHQQQQQAVWGVGRGVMDSATHGSREGLAAVYGED